MATQNQIFGPRLTQLGLHIPQILLPRPDIPLDRWAVVACDQYTSDQAYWDAVNQVVGEAPSTLRLILPELYLGGTEVPERVRQIQENMQAYLEGGVLASQGECLIYVRRTTEHSGLREGLVIALDLERYDYSPGSLSLIRATEGTIVERIPPRLAIRRPAPLEVPHIMVLLEDPTCQLIEGLGTKRHELTQLYDVELMQHGGRIEGYRLAEPAHLAALLDGLERALKDSKLRQGTEHPLFFAMGDGNHSLATAKAAWEAIKQEYQAEGQTAALAEHPARFALVELVNVYSPGLRFEPIHRVVFTEQLTLLTQSVLADPAFSRVFPIEEQGLQTLLAGSDGQHKAGYFDGERYFVLEGADPNRLPPALVDEFFARFAKQDPSAKIDFIHGWEDTRKLAQGRAGCFFVPVLARERLFSHVATHGPLPRKAFSMGHAEEKRYYMEARKIAP